MPSQIPFDGDDEATTLASTTAAPLVVKRGPISSNDAVLDAPVDSTGSGNRTEVGLKRNELTGRGSLTFVSGNQYVGSVKEGVLFALRAMVVSHQEYGHAKPSANLKPVSEQSASFPCRYDGGRRHVYLGRQWCSL